MMKLSFTKMHGLGNDFVLVMSSEDALIPSKDQLVAMADRRCGVGFDQLLWLVSSRCDDADFSLRIFNADGSEAEQCGNGLRCVGRYIHDQGLAPGSRWSIDTAVGICEVWHDAKDHYGAQLSIPIREPKTIPFVADGMANLYRMDSPWGQLQLGVISMGNPHALLRVDDFLASDLEQQVRFVSEHERFPHGVNVGVCVVEGPNHLRLRVFERGAGWTNACGTGAAACMVIATLNLWLGSDQVTVTQPGGDLAVYWPHSDAKISIAGATQRVFDGEWYG